MNEIDLNTYNHIDNLVYHNTDQFFDQEKYTENHDVIFNQLEDFNNLGQDMFKELNLDETIENKILYDVIDFVKENYLNLADKDYMLNSTYLRTNGMLIYQFLCVDCFNIILPKLLEQLNIQNIEQFDKVLSRNSSDINYIKTQFISNISEILNNLLKLQKIDSTIVNDNSYKKLVNRFGYYLELIDFSDSYNFTENYIRPVMNKYFSQLLWRTL